MDMVLVTGSRSLKAVSGEVHATVKAFLVSYAKKSAHRLTVVAGGVGIVDVAAISIAKALTMCWVVMHPDGRQESLEKPIGGYWDTPAGRRPLVREDFLKRDRAMVHYLAQEREARGLRVGCLALVDLSSPTRGAFYTASYAEEKDIPVYWDVYETGVTVM